MIYQSGIFSRWWKRASIVEPWRLKGDVGVFVDPCEERKEKQTIFGRPSTFTEASSGEKESRSGRGPTLTGTEEDRLKTRVVEVEGFPSSRRTFGRRHGSLDGVGGV